VSSDPMISISEVLCRSSSLKEILWNVSRFKDEEKRLTLKQNPHFYKGLPTIPDEYGDRFRFDPIETFQGDKICVLTDNPGQTGRVFLDISDKMRAFGNVWVPKNAIIFKGSYRPFLSFPSVSDILIEDVCGKLEGESIVGAAIRDTPNLWYFEEPPLSPAARPTLSPSQNSPSPTMSATSTSSVGVPIQDWREPIRRMLQSLDINIRITAKRPSNISPNCPSSPVPPAGSSSSEDSLLPIVLPPLRPPIKLQIPAQSVGPLTPSSYRTALTTPLSQHQQSPAVELSPKTGTTLSPAPPPVLPSQASPSMEVSPSPVALAMPRIPHLPTVALTPTKRAAPAPPIARTLPGMSQSLESQRIAFSPPSPVALSVPLPGQPPTAVSPLTDPALPAPPTCILPDGPQVPLPQVAVSVLHPKPPTAVAPPSVRRAIAAPPTAHILPDISLSRESRTVVVPQEAEAPVSSPVPIAGVPLSVLNVTSDSPWQIINASKPQTEGHKGEIVNHVHSQASVPGPINGGVSSAARDRGVPSLSPPVQAPATVTQPHDQPNVQSKSWFRKYVWDYKK